MRAPSLSAPYPNYRSVLWSMLLLLIATTTTVANSSYGSYERVLPGEEEGRRSGKHHEHSKVHPILESSIEHKKREQFLYNLEKQMGVQPHSNIGSINSSDDNKNNADNKDPSGDDVNDNNVPKRVYQDPAKSDYTKPQNPLNGLYYDPQTGSYIDPTAVVSVDDNTTAALNGTTTDSTSSNTTIVNGTTVTTITTTTTVTMIESNITSTSTSNLTATQEQEIADGGIFYDPTTGNLILDPSSQNTIPDTFYYYARKGSGASKKSKKGKSKKGCKKRKQGKKSSKNKKSWYECKYYTPKVHPDKVYPKECIYDYANHIRYCKKNEIHEQGTASPTCVNGPGTPVSKPSVPIPSGAPVPTIPIAPLPVSIAPASPLAPAVVPVSPVFPTPAGPVTPSTVVPSIPLFGSDQPSVGSVGTLPVAFTSVSPVTITDTDSPAISPIVVIPSSTGGDDEGNPSTGPISGSSSGPVAAPLTFAPVVLSTSTPTSSFIGTLPPTSSSDTALLSDVPSSKPSVVPAANIISTPTIAAIPQDKSGDVATTSPSPSWVPPPSASPTKDALYDMNSNETLYEYEKSVETGAILRVVSEFDPWDKADDMFEIVKGGFAPYSMALIGGVLQNVTMTMSFLKELTSYERSSRGSATGAIATFYADMNVTFDFTSLDPTTLDAFTEQKVSLVLRQYFEGDMKTRLFDRLADSGLRVKDVTVLNDSPDGDDSESDTSAGNVSNVNYTDVTGDDNSAETASGQGSSSSTESTSEGQKKSSAAIKAAAISGAIAIAAIGLVLYASNQRGKKNCQNQLPVLNQDLCGDSNYDSDDDKSKAVSYITDSTKNTGNVSCIQPLPEQYKLQVPKKLKSPISTDKKKSSIVEAKERSYRASPRFFSSKASSTTIKQSNAKPTDQELKRTDSEDLIRFEDGPDLVVNPECSPGDENAKTTDFDMYQLTKPTLSGFSGWPSLDDVSVSTPAYSIAESSNMDDEEYKESRRKWQESVNDLDSIPMLDNKTSLHSQTDSKVEGSIGSQEGGDAFGFFPSDDLLGLMEDVNLNDKNTAESEEKKEETDETPRVRKFSV